MIEAKALDLGLRSKMCRRVRCADEQGLWGEMDQKWVFHMLLAWMLACAGLILECSVHPGPSWNSRRMHSGGPVGVWSTG